MVVEEQEFPASADSLAELRRWADALLRREDVPDALTARSVLVLSELTAQTVRHLRPEARPLTVRVRVHPSGIGLCVRCAVQDLSRERRPDEEQRQFYVTLLDAFSDHHGWCGSDDYRARFAEIDWQRPRPRPTVLPVVSGAPPRPVDWPGAPPR